MWRRKIRRAVGKAIAAAGRDGRTGLHPGATVVRNSLGPPASSLRGGVSLDRDPIPMMGCDKQNMQLHVGIGRRPPDESREIT